MQLRGRTDEKYGTYPTPHQINTVARDALDMIKIPILFRCLKEFGIGVGDRARVVMNLMLP